MSMAFGYLVRWFVILAMAWQVASVPARAAPGLVVLCGGLAIPAGQLPGTPPSPEMAECKHCGACVPALPEPEWTTGQPAGVMAAPSGPCLPRATAPVRFAGPLQARGPPQAG